MAKRKKIDGAKLIKMVEDGVHQSDIMKKFGFANGTQVTLAYAKAQMQAGKIPSISGGRGSGKGGAVNKIKIGESGRISISKDIVTEFGFAIGDEFTVKKRGSVGISLKKMEAEAEKADE
jgi:ABC-type proline/glycine betaine transport system ATPase subunit